MRAEVRLPAIETRRCETQCDYSGDQLTTTGRSWRRRQYWWRRIFRPTDIRYRVNYKDAYLGDTILLRDLTIQAARSRYDLQKEI